MSGDQNANMRPFSRCYGLEKMGPRLDTVLLADNHIGIALRFLRSNTDMNHRASRRDRAPKSRRRGEKQHAFRWFFIVFARFRSISPHFLLDVRRLDGRDLQLQRLGVRLHAGVHLRSLDRLPRLRRGRRRGAQLQLGGEGPLPQGPRLRARHDTWVM